MLPFLLAAQVAAASDVNALVAKARLARYQQDSALAEYQTIARQRMSSGIGLSSIFGAGVPGPEKLAARFESIARMGWNHRTGAWGEVIGSRGVAPIVGQTEPDGDAAVALVLPYYPGSDALWPMTELRGAFHDHRDWITHPLDAGSDSLYEFSLGDSLAIRLPDGTAVRMREIVVRPRRPSEKLIVGSLWVDVAGGNLVRAAYRPSTPVDLWPLISGEMEGDSREDKEFARKFGPYTGIVREVVIEDGLYEGRFWLPRIRTARGEGTAHGVRVTISIDQTFTYEKVRAVAPGEIAFAQANPVDTAADGRVRYRRWNGRVIEGPCRQLGDSSSRWNADSLASGATRLPVEYVQGIRFRILSACDEDDLARSPALGGSIYDSGEELFTETDFDRLRRDVQGALSMDRQAKFQPQPTVITWGWKRGTTRYNRIEGLSIGAIAEKTLGNGYVSEYIGRFGIADRQPNGEASLRRTNARSEWRTTAFRRLASANEWGDPFALGPSAVALLFGRDDGLYFRTLGVEATGFFQPSPTGIAWTWRLFAEREDSAPVRTHFSAANAINGVHFLPNIQADAGLYEGASLVAMRSWGSNPRGTRTSSLWRADAATGESQYARASVELTLSQGLGGSTEAAITASGGIATGNLPAQRLWYLGGPQTVRGFGPGAMAGDAFWFGRFELAHGHPAARPSIFADVGWAGIRDLQPVNRGQISGIGLGMTIVDGLLRFDIARSSAGRFRADLYLNPR
jgi:hypothetical protein